MTTHRKTRRPSKCRCGSGVVLSGGRTDCYQCDRLRRHKPRTGMVAGSSRVLRGHEQRVLYYQKMAAWGLPLFADLPEPEGWPEKPVAPGDAETGPEG